MVRATGDAHVVAVPRDGDRILVLPQAFAPAPAAQQRFQQLSNAYVDGCLTGPSCTLHGFDGIYKTADGHVYSDTDVRQATWHVVRYPAVDLPGVLGRAPDGKVAFSGQVTVPGVLRVDGTTAAGRFTATCLFEGTWYALNAWVDAAGTLQTGWAAKHTGAGPRIEVDCRTWT
jgi:hypothetical protein